MKKLDFSTAVAAITLCHVTRKSKEVKTTVAKSAYYTRLWASFFVKLQEKIPGRGLQFFGLI